jgi:hypothetical protein
LFNLGIAYPRSKLPKGGVLDPLESREIPVKKASQESLVA